MQSRITMWERLALVIVGLLVLTAILPTGRNLAPAVAQDADKQWPYIYYPGYNGWIIERADGSDRHILGQGLACGLTMNHTWSPSGHWLLWECGQPPAGPNARRAVRYDGSRRLTLLEQFNGQDVGMAWSPLGNDTLAVYSLYTPTTIEAQERGPGIYLIDAERDEYLWQHKLERGYTYWDINWSPDGRFILLEDLVLPADGSEPFTRSDLSTQLGWLPDGRILYRVPDSSTLIAEDLASGAQAELSFTSVNVRNMQWNHAHDQVLIFAENELWRLSMDGLALDLISDQIVPLPATYGFIEATDAIVPDSEIWSPDDSGALVTGGGGFLNWFDAASGTLIPTPLPPSSGTSSVKRVLWGGDYGFVLWNNEYYVYAYTENAVWDILNLNPSPPGYSMTTESAVSSDGRYLAFTRWGHGFSVLDWQAGAELRTMPNPTVEEIDRMSYGLAEWIPGYDVVLVAEMSSFPPTAMNHWSVLSADGKLYRPFFAHIITAPHGLPQSFDLSGLALLPSIPAARTPFSFQAHNGWTGLLAWSPDGRTLVTAETYDYGGTRPGSLGGDPVRVWNAGSGEKLGELPLGGCAGGAVPPGNSLRGAYLSLSARQDQAELSGYPENLGWVPNVDNHLVAVTIKGCFNTPDQLLFWDYTSGQITANYVGVRAFAFSADGAWVVLGYDDGSVSVQPFPMTGEEITHLTLDAPARFLVFDVDSTRLAVISRSVYGGPQAALTVWEIASPDQPLFSPIPAQNLHSISFSPDGTTLATTILPYRCIYPNQPPHLIDAATGVDLTEANEYLRGVSYSPDGRFLATGGCGTAIWNAKTPERIAQYPEIGLVVAWSPDGKRLAAGASYGVFIWDMPLVPGSVATVHVVNNDTLNVRSEASLSAEILVELNDGAIVTVLEGPVGADSYAWWRILTADGVEGWAVEEVDGIRTLIP